MPTQPRSDMQKNVTGKFTEKLTYTLTRSHKSFRSRKIFPITSSCARLVIARPRDWVCASLLFGERTVGQGRKAARRVGGQRGTDGIVIVLTGRVASQEEDAAGTMGRGSIGSALDPASPDIMRHDQSEGLPIGKNMGVPMPPTRFLLYEKPRESIGSPTGRVYTTNTKQRE